MDLTPELRRDLATYVTGYGLALLLTGGAFAIVYFHLFSKPAEFAAVLALAFIQVLVHMRCFLHVDFKRSARADLQLILFSTMIICLMVGGTLVILFNLQARMM
ncbi:MAG TPA: cytochrome C oxidase subunit IV family protein [Acidisoma sp.]|jgi:cytochrome o ubiquinol oxidase operon protein cyoD|uniref:cytochrome o ubiquinol oxidase subunit IV n=1 Tax=Acidisoma sp. TaxID=1872115 RepID=UPI002B76DE4A|nr:cytochrome C oxidase subunit IV family protein [Acidisoma sp.]HTI00960.1 cytochrome C oxidase subunit IV family protein [Acidisoma sp.]